MNNGNFYDDPIQNTRLLPERVAYFRFADYEAGKSAGENANPTVKPPVTINGLNVRFRVRQLASVGYAGGYEGEFGICNLGRELMSDLANIYEAPKGDQPGYRRVQFYAGYQNAQANSMLNGAALVLDGNILKTHVATAPPDVWFEFRAFTYLKDIKEDIIVGGDKGVDFKSVLIWASQKCGFDAPLYLAKTEFTVKQFKISGTVQKVMEDLQYAASLNKLILLQRFGKDQKIQLVVCDKEEKATEQQLSPLGNTWRISEQNGMIGVPEISIGHATVTTQFNPHIRPLDTVYLKSNLMPYWNDKFFVARIEHFGELRGKDFCTRLDLLKKWS